LTQQSTTLGTLCSLYYKTNAALTLTDIFNQHEPSTVTDTSFHPTAASYHHSHDSTGRAVVSHSGPVPKTFPVGPQGPSFVLIHSTPTLPAFLVDLSTTAPIPISSPSPGLPHCPPAGALFVIYKISPGAGASMHRTASIDQATVLAGEISYFWGAERRWL
jgi:hypothetical protein